jgi:hypothetical protein
MFLNAQNAPTLRWKQNCYTVLSAQRHQISIMQIRNKPLTDKLNSHDVNIEFRQASQSIGAKLNFLSCTKMLCCSH